MSKDRSVFKRDGVWHNKRNDASKSTSTHGTQAEAIQAAKQNLLNQGGGDLSVMGLNGKIRSKDTYGKKDPFPPRDTEH